MARQQIDYAGVVLAMDPEQEERKQVRTQLQWDYGQVPALHRKAVEDAAVEILVSGRKMQQSVLLIGQRLSEVKRLLDHGQFGDWCEREFGMNVRTAQRMMSVAANLDGKSDKLSHLGTSVLYLIGADSTPEPVREAVIQQAESTGRSPAVAEVRKAIRLFVENLRGIVRLWAEEHWLRSGREIPPNPAHTNGQFWQELTAWLHGNVTDTWTEGDLKAAINQEYRYEARAAQLAQAPVKVERTTPVASLPKQITDSELSDICETVANEMFGNISPNVVNGLALAMESDVQVQNGPYWRRLLRALEPHDIPFVRIQAAVAHATQRMVAERVATNAEPEPLTAADMHVMQAAPGRATDEQPPIQNEAATGDARLGKMRRLVSLYEMVSNSFDEFGELTGRDTETLAAGREMRKLIGWLEREISLLEGREVEPLELESEGWG